MMIDRLNRLRVMVVHLLGGQMRYGLPFYGSWAVWWNHKKMRKLDRRVLRRIIG